MTILSRAKSLYDSNGASLEGDIAAYLKNGYLYSEPGMLLLGRPTSSQDPLVWIDASNKHTEDAWFVKFAAGNGAMKRFIKSMPYYLPLICWGQDFRKPGASLKFFKTETVIRHVMASI